MKLLDLWAKKLSKWLWKDSLERDKLIAAMEEKEKALRIRNQTISRLYHQKYELKKDVVVLEVELEKVMKAKKIKRSPLGKSGLTFRN